MKSELWWGAVLALATFVVGVGCGSDPAPVAEADGAAACIGAGCVGAGAAGVSAPGSAAAPTAQGAAATGPSATASPPTTNAQAPAVAAPSDDAAQAGAAAPPAGLPMPATGMPPAAAAPSEPMEAAAPPPGAEAVPSAGCSVAAMPPSGPQTLDVDGTAREFIVQLPEGYDANRPYRLIFGWHGLGGSAMQVAGGWGGGFYGQAARSENSAVLIAGQGLPTMSANGEAGGAGWPNSGGRDVAFARKLVEFAQTNYCIDQSRVFSVGMSYGGIMSNTVGCELGDLFRAIAPIAGAGPRSFGGSMCTGQVAAWLAHGNMDTVVSFESGQGSRDHWVTSNHCQAQTTPVGPDKCVAYEGCDAGYPVHWCEFDGQHTVPAFAAEAIWSFFSQF